MDALVQQTQLALRVLQGSTSSRAHLPVSMLAQTKVLSIILRGVPARNVTQSAAPAAALRLTTAILARPEQLR